MGLGRRRAWSVVWRLKNWNSEEEQTGDLSGISALPVSAHWSRAWVDAIPKYSSTSPHLEITFSWLPQSLNPLEINMYDSTECSTVSVATHRL